jgi:hypothetical protein
MKPLRWWVPLVSAVVALAFGFLPYALLTASAKIPDGLRDNPWPMELVAVVATGVAVALAVFAYRQKRARAVATASAAVATLATAVFVLLVHVGSYDLPPPPKELAVGTVAADFVLPDEAGNSVALAAMRGRSTLLVFYRGAW